MGFGGSGITCILLSHADLTQSGGEIAMRCDVELSPESPKAMVHSIPRPALRSEVGFPQAGCAFSSYPDELTYSSRPRENTPDHIRISGRGWDFEVRTDDTLGGAFLLHSMLRPISHAPWHNSRRNFILRREW